MKLFLKANPLYFVPQFRRNRLIIFFLCISLIAIAIAFLTPLPEDAMIVAGGQASYPLERPLVRVK